MFCPRCATQNSDEVKYCRACREDLHLVSLALKKHSPVMLVSKIDSALGSRSERIRRESVLGLILAICFLVYGLAGLLQGKTSWLSFLCVAVSSLVLLWSLWNYLAYKHSLSLGWAFERDELLPTGKGNLTDNMTPTVNLKEQALRIDPSATLSSKEINRGIRLLRCPVCSAPFSNQGKYCHQCGENLAEIYKAMKQSTLRSALDRWLDKYVKWTTKKGQKVENSGKVGILMMVSGGCMFLASSITWFGEHRFDRMDPINLSCGVTMFVGGLGDYLFYRQRQSLRNKASAVDSLPTAPASHGEIQPPTTNKLLEPPSSVTEATTIKLADRIREKAKRIS